MVETIPERYRKMVELANELAKKDRESFPDINIHKTRKTEQTPTEFEFEQREKHLIGMLGMYGPGGTEV